MNREELLKIAKPVLFNTEMVQAILEGRKTVTRRVVKFLDGKNPNWTGYIKDGLTLYNGTNEPCNKKPPFRKGDYLYIRETWGEDKHNFLYKADFSENDLEKIGHLLRWRPSIHMPKEAARIFSKVTDVRVERLQMMNGKDVLKEGVDNGSSNPTMGYRFEVMQRTAFKDLWNSTIKTADLDKYGWDANPWVWIIEFERVEV